MANGRTYYGGPKEKTVQHYVAGGLTIEQLEKNNRPYTRCPGHCAQLAEEKRKQVEQNTVRALWKAVGFTLGVVSVIALYPACTELFAGNGEVVAKQGVQAVTQMAQAVVPVVAALGAHFCFRHAKQLAR